MRVVLDPNTIVSALLRGGIPDRLLAAATEARIDLFSSRPLLTDLGNVLACALAAQADLIVSGDAGLLDLKTVQRIPIVTVSEALTRLSQL